MCFGRESNMWIQMNVETKRNPLKNQEIPFQCFGRESNPYGHFWPRDFKSRVSTYSTTKANRAANIIIF